MEGGLEGKRQGYNNQWESKRGETRQREASHRTKDTEDRGGRHEGNAALFPQKQWLYLGIFRNLAILIKPV